MEEHGCGRYEVRKMNLGFDMSMEVTKRNATFTRILAKVCDWNKERLYTATQLWTFDVNLCIVVCSFEVCWVSRSFPPPQTCIKYVSMSKLRENIYLCPCDFAEQLTSTVQL